MFCPGCGAGEQSADAYCKRCGAWLPETSGIIRRALWGEGIEPEQRLRAILTRQLLSGLLAFVSAGLLFAMSRWLDASSVYVKVVAGLCLLVGAMQVDGFLLTVRMRQGLRRNRAEAETGNESAGQSRREAVDEGGQLRAARVDSEEPTEKLDSLALGRKR